MQNRRGGWHWTDVIATAAVRTSFRPARMAAPSLREGAISRQLTARGVMEPSALYEAPFSSVQAGGPEALFAGRSNVIEGIFEKLKTLHPETLAETG